MAGNESGDGQKSRKKIHRSNCLGCGVSMVWQDQKKQFVRMKAKGFSVAAAKEAMPRCQKCCTVLMRDNGK